MQAQSFVGGLRAIDHCAQMLLESTRLEREASRQQGLTALSTLSTLVAQIRDGTPLSVSETEPEGRKLVELLLDRHYEDGVLEASDLDPAVRDRVRRSERVSIVGSTLIIPLGEGGTEHNWRPVFRLLLNRLAETGSKIKRIVARHSDPSARRIWETVAESIRDLRTFLKSQLANQERLHRLFTRPAEKPAEFAIWTLDQFSETRSKL